jgi:4-amino-4-deoxy-L-arabinose transferase-like glycosyltransferase
MRTRELFAWKYVVPVAIAELVVQVAFANGYGYHRDELYFRTAARHPAFGYDDQGPLTPLLGRLDEALFGQSPRGLRVASAVAVALIVVVIALLARELGAGATGQLVAAGCAAVSTFVVVLGHLLTTETFDALAWTALVLVVARILGGGDPRLWLAAGAVAGVGLQNKQLPLLLVLALALGLAFDRRLIEALRSRWLWLGVVVTCVIWFPNLIWQATHGWPQLDLAEDIRKDEGGESRATLLPFQLLVIGPLLTPVWIAGLVALFRDRTLRPWRWLGLAYLSLLVLLFVLEGKPYYAGPLVLCLLAPGAVVVEGWLRSAARAVLLAAAVTLTAAVSVTLALPVIPVGSLHDTPVADISDDVVETVGWPALVRMVANVYERLPAGERESAVIFTGNYGEAGAIDRFGAAYGLPRAYSGHNAYARFGVPADGAGPVILVGYATPTTDFVDCRAAAVVDNGVDLENEEQGGTVYVCARPKRPWSEIWASLRHLDA